MMMLDRIENSIAHKLVETAGGGLIRDDNDAGANLAAYLSILGRGVWPQSRTDIAPLTVFLINHNWGAVVERADAIADEVRFPSTNCIFEMSIGGRRAIIWNAHQRFVSAIQAENKTGWRIRTGDQGGPDGDFYAWPQMDTYDEMKKFVVEKGDDLQFFDVMYWASIHARAACIMLDAEVLTSSVVRAPEKLNRQRIKKGRTPLFDYRVLDLSRRRRVAPAENPSHSGKKLRLHFVRGHWRHFEESKTWVRWHLRGDPDLGRIEKEYRL